MEYRVKYKKWKNKTFVGLKRTIFIIWGHDKVSVEKSKNEKFCSPLFERCFQVRDFSFWITEGFDLTEVNFHF
jgi:hypothetical protein